MRRSRTVFRGESLYVLENVKQLRKHRPLSGIETGNSSCCTTPYQGKKRDLWIVARRIQKGYDRRYL
jgi:hypothetical protein